MQVLSRCFIIFQSFDSRLTIGRKERITCLNTSIPPPPRAIRFGAPRQLAFSIAACFFLASPALADLNLVQNPGFETGNFADWTVTGNPYDYPWSVDNSGSFAGGYNASTGCVGALCISGTPTQQSSLSQTLATTAGQTYDLTFEFSTFGASTPDELAVLWNGSVVLDLGPGGTLGSIPNWELFSVSGLAATSSSTTLTFLGRQDPGSEALDNVDVEAVETPEPSLSLWAVGAFFSLLWLVRRRSQAPSR